MMKCLKNNKGVTLIELLIAVAVLSLLAAGTITVISTGLNAYSDNMKSAQEQPSIRFAMIQVTKLVRDPANEVKVDDQKHLLIKYAGQTIYKILVLEGGVSIKAAYTDASQQVIQVDISAGDATMSTKLSKNNKESGK